MNIISNIITKQDAKTLMSNEDMFCRKIKVFDGIALDVVKKIRVATNIKFNLKDNSYWKVEKRPNGHNWHYDTGTNDHMTWCDYSVSILLSDPNFKGGDMIFKLDKSNYTVDKKEHYLSALHYRSNKKEKLNKHMVTKHNGERIVLLLFLEYQK